MSKPLTSPQTSHEAAEQLHDLGTRLGNARDVAETHARLRDRFEQLYRQASAYALMHDEVTTLGSEDRRKAAVASFTVKPDVREMGTKLATSMGLDGTTPDTVGDLRWLRDRAASLAESHSARAYDVRALVQAWTVVAAMARSEMQIDQHGERRPAA